MATKKKTATSTKEKSTPKVEVGEQHRPNAEAPKEPVSMVVQNVALHVDKHAKKTFTIKNKNPYPLTVNLCAGNKQRLHVKKGAKIELNKGLPEACRTCPGREFHLLDRENKEVQAVYPQCFDSDQVRGLLETNQIRIQQALDKKDHDGNHVKTLTIKDIQETLNG